MKQILVVCGAGVATSTVAAQKVREKLSERGIAVEVRQCKATEVPYELDRCDLIVTTTLLGDVAGKPVVQTVSFLTGVGIDADIDRIVALLQGTGA